MSAKKCKSDLHNSTPKNPIKQLTEYSFTETSIYICIHNAMPICQTFIQMTLHLFMIWHQGSYFKHISMMVKILMPYVGYLTGVRCDPRCEQIAEVQYISARKQVGIKMNVKTQITSNRREPTPTPRPAFSAGLTARRDWSAGRRSLHESPCGAKPLSLHLTGHNVQSRCPMADDGLNIFP